MAVGQIRPPHSTILKSVAPMAQQSPRNSPQLLLHELHHRLVRETNFFPKLPCSPPLATKHCRPRPTRGALRPIQLLHGLPPATASLPDAFSGLGSGRIGLATLPRSWPLRGSPPAWLWRPSGPEPGLVLLRILTRTRARRWLGANAALARKSVGFCHPRRPRPPSPLSTPYAAPPRRPEPLFEFAVASSLCYTKSRPKRSSGTPSRPSPAAPAPLAVAHRRRPHRTPPRTAPS